MAVEADADDLAAIVDAPAEGPDGLVLVWDTETADLVERIEGVDGVTSATVKLGWEIEAVNAFDETKRVHLTGTFTAKRASLDDEAFSMHQLAARTK